MKHEFEKGNKKGNRFKPGQSGNPNGRPKKILSSLKDLGYTESQVMDAIKAMMAMSIQELGNISKDKTGQYTALETVCAGAVVANHKRKTQYALLQLIERVFGKARESVTHELTGTIEVTLDLGHGTDTED